MPEPARLRRQGPGARAKLLGLAGGLALGLLGLEGGLRLFASTLSLDSFVEPGVSRERIYRVSKALGYEPIPGEGGYNEHGVLDYGHSVPRRRRLLRILVLGDSITHRRLWVEMLDRRLTSMLGPRRPLEMWNAGVEGYNTVQEEAYLRQTGVHLRADLVLLQFHLNDFLPLPVLFQDQSGEVAYQPFESAYGKVNEPLFRWSYVYRWLLLRWRPSRESRQESSRQAVEGALRGMRELCQQHGMELFVAVFPLFKARAAYGEAEQLWHRWVLEILKENAIDFVDLHGFFPTDAAMDAYRESPEDPWHPNTEGHRLAATGIFTALRTRPMFGPRRVREPRRGLAPGL